MELGIPTDFLKQSDHFIAICGGCTDASGRHVGFLIKDDENPPLFFDLAFHFYLRRKRVDAELIGYRWVGLTQLQSSEDPEFVRAKGLLILLNHFYEKYRDKTPYGINYDDTTYLNEERELILNDNVGLTCATYVLLMLKYAGFDLLNVGEWSYREGDKEWVENVSRTIRAYCENRGFDPSHAEKVIAEAHKPRIRPEEVMAGAILAPPQSTFVDCVALGEKILEYLRDIKRSTE